MTNPGELDRVEREIEISIDQARGAVDRKNKMEKLINTPEFRDVFTVGYMEQEPARLVSLLADSDWQTPEKQEELLHDMRAISALRQYILGIKAMGKTMENQIIRSQETLNGLREEGE